MHRNLAATFGCGMCLLLSAGCWTTEWTKKRELKPPPHPEEYVLPPVTSNRFSAPPDFPRQNDKDRYAKHHLDEPAVPGNMGPGNTRFGSGPGMRGP